MKRLQLTGAMLGLTVLLTACPSPTPPTPTHSLTVKVEGVPNATVTVMNTTTKAQVFSGTLEGSKTFASLKAGDVFEVTGAAVNGYTAPAAQTVTLDASKTVTLAYRQVDAPGSVLSAERVAGAVEGNTLKLNNVYLGSSRNVFYARGTVDAGNRLSLDLSPFAPTGDDLDEGFFEGCAGTNTNPAARTLVSSRLNAYSPQGDLLGRVFEEVVAGEGASRVNPTVLRMYSDADFSFTGTCLVSTGSGTQVTWDVNAQIKRGWNVLVLSGSGERRDLRNASADTRVRLTFQAARPSVSVQLDPDVLSFNSDGPVTVKAQIAQVGGFSGTVSLSTDVPGLTVEPGTVTLPELPRLGAQSTGVPGTLVALAHDLAPQTVNTTLTFRYTGTANVSSLPFTLGVQNAAGQSVGQGQGVLNVYRRGISVFANTPGFQVTLGNTGLLPVSVTSVAGFSGSVTVRLEDLPAGISANTRTVNLSADGAANADLSLTGAAGLVPGEYTATLLAEGGDRTARSSVKLVVPKPTVTVRVEGAYNGVSVYQGEQGSVPVSVTGNFGFSGTTTLTLTGLPAGITTQPVTVRVTPNTTTTVNVPLVVAADATPGVSTVRVTSPDSANQGSPDTFQLSVKPARTVLAAGALGLAPAPEGVWVLGNAPYDAAAATYRSPLTRYVGGAAASNVTLPFGASSLMALPSGDLLVFGGYNGEAVRVDGAGNVTPLSTPPAGAGAGAADAQGRVWYIRTASVGMGGSQTLLEHWDPATGARVTVDSTRSYGYGTGRFAASASGNVLVYIPGSSDGAAVRIDTVTGSVTPLDLPLSASGSAAAISDAGTLWYSSYSGPLKRVNADGSTTTFDNLTNIDRLLGFDRANPEVLWAASFNQVFKLDTAPATPVRTALPVSSVTSGTVLRGGGAAVVTSEFVNGTQQAALTVLR